MKAKRSYYEINVLICKEKQKQLKNLKFSYSMVLSPVFGSLSLNVSNGYMK